jgi:Fe2+ transport system protein B
MGNNSFSQFFNISKKKDALEAFVFNVRDNSTDEDMRIQAERLLENLGCVSPVVNLSAADAGGDGERGLEECGAFQEYHDQVSSSFEENRD